MVSPAADVRARRKRPETSGFSKDKQKPAPPMRRDHPQYVDVDAESPGKNASLSALGKEERVIIRKEKPELRKVLGEFRDRAREVNDKVAALVRRAEDEAREDPGPRDEGAAFLAAKQMLLLSYCRDICSYAAVKGRGESLGGGGPSGRLVELRTVMEKLRPMDRKLKYHTDKLLRLATASSGEVGDSHAVDDVGDDDEDPLSFRPRPEAMAPWGDEADGERDERVRGVKHASSSEAGDGGDSGLYRAPRLASVPYDEDGEGVGAARGQRRLEKRRDKLRRGEVMETLREEFGDQPETVRAVGNAGASGVSEAKMKRILEEDKDRLDFEEDHMVRLTVTRKAKKARAQMEKDAGRLETIADVGSAADFVRVARGADGFGAEMEGGEDDNFSGGRGRKSRGRGGDGSALGRAMGAVGGAMRGGGGRGGKGRKRSRK